MRRADGGWGMSQKRYEAIRPYATTVPLRGGTAFHINYERGNPIRDHRKDAITDGFERFGSDDFNIAVWHMGALVSWDWMEKPVGEDDKSLAEIARKLGADGGWA
jgi:hypothetical protein